MTRQLTRSGSVLLVVGTLFAIACDDLPRDDALYDARKDDAPQMDWTPILRTPLTPYLSREVVRAQTELENARESLPADTGIASAHLDATGIHLQRLRNVYLPLLEARGRAHNAYRLEYLGRETDAISELWKVRTMIVAVSYGKSGPFRAELDRIRELEADARARVEARSPSAADGVRELALALDGIMDRAETHFDAGG